MTNHKYYLFLRPLSIGTYPRKNVIKTESWLPKKKAELDFLNIDVFGFVIYSEKLTFETISKYELIPANKNEYARYMIWEKSNKDRRKAKEIEKMYKKLELKELIKYKNRDKYAFYILLLLNKYK